MTPKRKLLALGVLILAAAAVYLQVTAGSRSAIALTSWLGGVGVAVLMAG